MFSRIQIMLNKAFWKKTLSRGLDGIVWFITLNFYALETCAAVTILGSSNKSELRYDLNLMNFNKTKKKT